MQSHIMQRINSFQGKARHVFSMYKACHQANWPTIENMPLAVLLALHAEVQNKLTCFGVLRVLSAIKMVH